MNGAWKLASMAALLVAGFFVLRPEEATSAPPGLRFVECARSVGLIHRHTLCRLSPRFANIMPWLTSVGAAAAAADVDGDGWIDLYVTSSGRNDSNRLFRNRGDGTFVDATAGSGAEVGNREGASMHAVFGDTDNDGDPDLYVVRWGAENLFLENIGSGRFRDATDSSGTGYWGYGNGATFLDYDRDGRLDLFVANYFPESLPDPVTGAPRRVDLWDPFTTRVMQETFTDARNGGRNVLYRNLGGNRFEDVTDAVGVGHTGWSLAAGAADLDNDGWPDLYVANDFGPDEVYFNTGGKESPPRFRSYVGSEGHPAIGDDWWKGMNVDFGDVDGNGYLDIYVTNILAPGYKTDEGNMLWLNEADPAAPHGRGFVNVGRRTGTHDGGWGWGAKFADFDADGRLDIFEVNGFVTGARDRTYWYALQEMVTQLKNATSDASDWPEMGDRDLSGYEPSRLWLQVPSKDGAGEIAFVEVAGQVGIDDLDNGRGAVLLDAENDGDLDLYVANQGQDGLYYRNDLFGRAGAASAASARAGSSRARWLGLDLVGGPGDPAGSAEAAGRALRSTRDAVGARVTLFSRGRVMLREVSGGTGFASQSDRRIHFGLGEGGTVEGLEIRWPSGRVDRLGATEASALVGRWTRVEEGRLAGGLPETSLAASPVAPPRTTPRTSLRASPSTAPTTPPGAPR